MNTGIRRGVATWRAWWGLAAAAIGLAGLTALLAPTRPTLSLASVALLYLVPVVAANARAIVNWPEVAWAGLDRLRHHQRRCPFARNSCSSSPWPRLP